MLAVVAAEFGDAFVTIIQPMFENLHVLSGDGRTANSADQFFGFATKHTAADDFNAPTMVSHHSPQISACGQKQRQPCPQTCLPFAYLTIAVSSFLAVRNRARAVRVSHRPALCGLCRESREELHRHLPQVWR